MSPATKIACRQSTDLRRSRKVLFALVGIAALCIAWPLVAEIARLRDYRRAESLHYSVWQLADVMKRFAKDRGSMPIRFDELQQFAPEWDFSDLRAFPHEFRRNGPVRFVLWANTRFAFTINDQFEMAWTSPEEVGPTPSP